MAEHLLMDANGVRRTIVRLAHEVLEKVERFDDVVFVGIKRGGETVAKRLAQSCQTAFGIQVPHAGVDVTMQRDDLVSAFFVPKCTENVLPFSVDEKTVVLCDDVLYTGRSVRAAIETLFSLGRPKRVLLLELIDRGGRQLPVRADFVGKNVPMAKSEYVGVYFVEDGAESDKIVIEKQKVEK